MDEVLLIEDTASLSLVYESILNRAGYRVHTAFTAAEGRAGYQARHSRVILLDLMLPDGDGIDVLREVHEADEDAKVIVITANGSIYRAVEAMREGAFDFLVKPFDERRLRSAVENAFQSLGLAPSVPAEDETSRSEFHGFIGSSPAMQEIYGSVASIARSTATVFITGESGTGKEVCAQAIHELSNRASGPFVPLNCGAIPADLLESEVFGHLKGSFTGAISNKTGAAGAADGGTLFLDEVCEMDMALQTKLLRFLQTSTIQPVGATRAHKVDVRIVCATNRDPMGEVRAGRFREDLFYRLHVVPIHLPPLRERGNDVNEIALHVLRRFSREESRRFRRLSPEVQRTFRTHPWPGNVRQLLNVLRNVVVLHDGEAVEMDMLPSEFLDQLHAAGQAPARLEAPPAAEPPAVPKVNGAREPQPSLGPVEAGEGIFQALVGMSLADVERGLIEATIEECGGSVPKAARVLDVSPSTIYRKREIWQRENG
ncbi:MAG: sigma-54-dependent Fis family transcriptional regulator [Alphaproteobacteria bacterium]|nr:MAG: sigma-54-dependent Fis family transcriptional regulator [Alphaproteobacteria bacterium]